MRNSLDFFKVLYPGLYHYYDEMRTALSAVDKLYSWYALMSVLSSTSLNCGDEVVTGWHIDRMNLALGICPIVPCGEFNPETSGHLWLNECRTILEVAPASVVFNLSSVVGHKNSPIQPGENRQSIVFHSSYRLFQWVYNGHQSVRDRYKTGGLKRETAEELIEAGLARLGCVSRFY